MCISAKVGLSRSFVFLSEGSLCGDVVLAEGWLLIVLYGVRVLHRSDYRQITALVFAHFVSKNPRSLIQEQSVCARTILNPFREFQSVVRRLLLLKCKECTPQARGVLLLKREDCTPQRGGVHSSSARNTPQV
jgi:hypothetical protein